jgi:hypothetical protein
MASCFRSALCLLGIVAAGKHEGDISKHTKKQPKRQDLKPLGCEPLAQSELNFGHVHNVPSLSQLIVIVDPRVALLKRTR